MPDFKFALLGTPIKHSLSPAIHKIFAEGCGVEIEYDLFDTDNNTLDERIDYLKNNGYNGFNCTMPLKSDIIEHAGSLSEQVKLLKAANTINLDKAGNMTAYATDGEGMVRGIIRNSYEIKDKTVFLLGAGGAARCCALSILEHGARELIILNRSIEGACSLAKMMYNYNNNFNIICAEANQGNIHHYCAGADIYINASNLGMKGCDEHSDFTFLGCMKDSALIVDAVYNPLDTQLLIEAKKAGKPTLDGFWMLVYQGVLAFEIWTGLKIPDETIQKAHNLISRQ